MSTRSTCTRSGWKWAVVLRTWVVALLALPALGFGPSPPVQAGPSGLDPGQETVLRAAAPLPTPDGKPVDALASAEAQEEEDSSKRRGDDGLAHTAEHGVVLAALCAFDCTAPERIVPCTPRLEHRLHNRGPPLR